MRDDLGTGDGEVHAQARAVLAFWFDEIDKEQRFAKDDAVDTVIAQRFGGLRDRVLATRAEGWRDDPETLMAAIVLLDQFSRNLCRGKAAAFDADPLARELTRIALDRGWHAAMPALWRQFAYMPLMHAEDPGLQAESVALFEALGDAEALTFARDHAAVIARFGRFPSRNAALGRISTPAEREYLSRPGAGW
ncbi:DUF924 family protein [Sphingomonas japonica]|uniref:Uncharacterized protein (DUF924 family) n=1 Tax=Sphingomonas japonica TaxID=511662 RepID=A0ABX0U2B9_9SPHN|nr:DUF924 family protein [Sphingomonas japonica]NIJ24660.1 uncharacterized protein (DUF924 family) [Sphingomonas japonica]